MSHRRKLQCGPGERKGKDIHGILAEYHRTSERLEDWQGMVGCVIETYKKLTSGSVFQHRIEEPCVKEKMGYDWLS